MKEFDFNGRSVLVTGGASGIGAAVAQAFGGRGATVHVLDRRAPDGDAGGFLAGDVTRRTEVEAAVQKVVDATGRLDVLVCCAGVVRDRVLWRMSDAEWSEVLDVNLTGSFYALRAAAAPMRAQHGGAVVLLSSINGQRGKAGQANYAASKAGVIALGKTAARELGRYGVRVNVVAPGYTDTPMTRGLPREVVEQARAETALGRLGQPGDVAGVVLFFASELARHVTGQVLRVDGGQYL